MLDQYGHRKTIIPAEVKGYFKKWKKRVHFVLLVFFLGLPWIQINHHPGILIDIPGRHFTFLGLSLYAHDVPLIFLVLAIMTLGLALITALFGRVWCGWACPQTVFIEAVYRQIEIWIEGDYIKRRKLRDSEMNLEKFSKLSLKWLAFLLVSSLIAHSFIAYFAGSINLLRMMQGSPSENWTYFLFITVMTGILLFNFGWFREQFCLIACPYGRFQSVLLDSHSVTVMYDVERGEPRKSKTSLKLANEKVGDCVACNRCVQVCPTGIDIRNGLQFECIGCTACIDACDEIMTKVKKPTGLIRYGAMTKMPVQWFRARVLVYSGLTLIALMTLIGLLMAQTQFRVEILRGKGLPFQIIKQTDGGDLVQNQFEIRIENDDDHPLTVSLEINDEARKIFQLIIPEKEIYLSDHEKRGIPFFVQVHRDQLSSNGTVSLPLRVRFQGQQNGQLEKQVIFVGPQSEVR